MAISNTILRKLLRLPKLHSRRENPPSHDIQDGQDEIHDSSTTFPYGSRSLSAQVAAVKSLYPAQDFAPVSQRRAFSADFGHLESGLSRAVQRPHSVHILQSPLRKHVWSESPRNRHHRLSWKRSPCDLPENKWREKSHADVHATQRRDAQLAAPERSPPLLQVPKRASLSVRPHSICSPIFAYEERRSSLSRKPDVWNLRNAPHRDHVRSFSLPISENRLNPHSSPRSPITKAHLDKPLPPIPLDSGLAAWNDWSLSGDDAMQSESGAELPASQHSPVVASVRGSPKTIHTTYYRRWAPAVTHETITRQVHDVREEHITRDIHNHHVYHRTLPIVDVELLPARHFVPTDTGLVEVPEDVIPTDLRPSEEWLTANVTSGLLPDTDECDSGETNTFGIPMANSSEFVRPDGSVHTESVHRYPAMFEPAIMAPEHMYAVRMSIDNGIQSRM